MAGPVLIFDSGVGGLSVVAELRAHNPGVALCYACDNAMLPYGTREDDWLTARILAVCSAAVDACRPSVLVVACNTASTLALGKLREYLSIPVVGTVPAIKPAAQASRTRHIGLLATSATIARPYTHRLIDAFAVDCQVTRVAADELVVEAETLLATGKAPDTTRINAVLSPLWQATRQTPAMDTVVLGCTHFPLLLPWLVELAPCPLNWIDSSPAIARRVAQVAPDLASHPLDGTCFTTAPIKMLEPRLAAYGFVDFHLLVIPQTS
ncbi:glutamate racemase [Vreelandella rituensis]|uniref:Glutamate racemase n=1 Tax=Vreelandella rituensis TaxID=2282306 RepID=A0A368TSU3_9GAMM|nr:glutamate racemase [Halomonas rituensis]RCV87406.1 glutamate racemase [Halomonas rituensis]